MVKLYLLLGALLFPVLLFAQPVITGLSPAANVHNVSLTTGITITFSQPMEAASEASLVVHGSLSGRIKGSYGGGGTTALSFQPQAPFKAGELLTVTLTTSTRSTGGVAMIKPYVYSFRAKAATAPVTFGAQQHLSAAGPVDMGTADLDGDGDVDIASIGNLFSGTGITLHLNNGTGVYTATKTIPLAMPTSLRLADFNGDGYVDVCATAYGYDPIIGGPYIFLNDGKGNFTGSLQVPVKSSAFDIKAGDLNGDGAVDLAFVGGGSDSLIVALNKGDGGFAPPRKWKVHHINPQYIAMADMDGDGDTDITASLNHGTDMTVFYNDGAGDFSNSRRLVCVAYNMATGDLDRDGDLDLVSPTGFNSNKAAIYLNDGAGTLEFAKFEDLGPQPMFAELADMDGDNDLDIVHARWGDFVSVMLNGSSDGLYYTPTPLIIVGNPLPGTSSKPRRLSAADLDGDLDLDLVTANSGNATLSVLLNGGTQPVISPLSLSYPAEGKNNTVSVNYPGSWTVSSGESWLTVTPAGSSGSATFTATAQANPLARERTATLTVSGGGTSRTLSVTQAGAAPTLGEVTPVSLYFPYYGGSSEVSITSNAATTVTARQDWLRISFASGFGDRLFYVGAGENPTGYSRTGEVIVSTGSLSETITVTQDAQPPRVYAEMSAPIAQEGGSATLTIESNTDWKINNPGDWYSFSTLRGSGNATVTVTAPANGSVYAKRIELILSAGETGGVTTDSEPVVVYQYGLPVVFAVSPAENIFWGADAQTGSFAITTNAHWSVTSDRPWLSVSPATGTGNGTVTFSAPAYTGTTNRTTTVRVTLPGLSTFKNFTVTQVPSFLSPSTLDFTALSESKTVQVSYPGNWSLSTDPWLTVSPAGGSGPATVTLTASTNPAGSQRTGKVTAQYTFAGGTPTQTLTVSQQGATLAVAPAAVTLPAQEASTDVRISSQITVNSNVSWRVSTVPDWLTISPQAGTGDAALTLVAQANPQVVSRTASLTFTAGDLVSILAVTQAGVPVQLSTSSTTIDFTAQAGNELLEVFSNTGWQLEGLDQLPGWLAVSTTLGSGNGAVTLTAQANPSLQVRTYTLTLTAGTETRTVTVNQAAADPFLTVSADTVDFAAEGETKSLTITANTAWTTAEPAAGDWYRLSTAAGAGSATIRITAGANADTSRRTVNLIFTGSGLTRRLTLTQKGTPAYLSVSPKSVSMLSRGESKTVLISSNLSWQLSAGASWLVPDKQAGKASGDLTFTAPANESPESRTCTLTVTAGALTRTITVSQLPESVSGPGLVLAPNPAHQSLKLTIGQQNGTFLPVQLYNSLGQSVAVYSLPVVGGKVEQVLQLAHLPRGLYILQVHSSSGLQRLKLLLQ